MYYWLLPPAGYLIGSVSSAILVSALLRLPDPRTSGSFNPGATNVLRLGSKTGAVATLFGDIAKGLLPVLLVSCWISDNASLIAVTALGAFLGHLYPLYYKFIGGKGVATALGILLAIDPIVGLIQVVTWLLIAFVFRYSSLAALVTAAATPLYLWVFGNETQFTVLGVVLGTLVFWRHRQNIKRLIKRTESKIHIDR